MTLLLTILGILVLLPSVVGIAFGGFMALDPKSRGEGVIFALWWVSGVAVSLGILVKDSATFAMGLFCFTVAGLALIAGGRHPRKPAFRHKIRHTGEDDENPRNDEEETRGEGSSRESEPEEPDEESSESVAEQPQTPPPNGHPETSIIADDNETASNEPEEDDPEADDPEEDGPQEPQEKH